MDYKREMCCLNNDYLSYLATRKRGRYNSLSHSRTRRTDENGRQNSPYRNLQLSPESEINATSPQDKTIKRAQRELCFMKGGPPGRLGARLDKAAASSVGALGTVWPSARLRSPLPCPQMWNAQHGQGAPCG